MEETALASWRPQPLPTTTHTVPTTTSTPSRSTANLNNSMPNDQPHPTLNENQTNNVNEEPEMIDDSGMKFFFS